MTHDNVYLEPSDIKHKLIVIKINDDPSQMDPMDVYDRFRFAQKRKKETVENADYVLGVYHSEIVAVYKPIWYTCREALHKLPERAFLPNGELREENEDRIFFIDERYELKRAENLYVGKTIDNYSNARAQNPITDLNPITVLED